MGRHRKLATTSPHPSLAPPLLSADELSQVIRALELSPQQGRIVEFLLQGKRDKQIASAMGLSVWTVRSHLTKTFVRLGVADRAELLLRIFRTVREGERDSHRRDL